MIRSSNNIVSSEEDSTVGSAIHHGQASLNHPFPLSDLLSWDNYPPIDPSLMLPQDYGTNEKDYTYPISYDLNNTPKATLTSDWAFSPSALSQSPYHESPLSSDSASAGIYQDPSWNPFEQSFATTQEDTTNTVFLPSRNSYQPEPTSRNYPPGNPRGYNGPSYVSLSAIDETSQYEDGCDESDDTPRPGPYMKEEERLQQQPKEKWQLAWGNPRCARRGSTASSKSTNSSTTLKQHKRRKSNDQGGPKSPTSPGFLPPNKQKLRSTSTSSSSKSIPSPTVLSPNKSWPRTNHNQVEKQYRNRLNGQFETLLQALPRDEACYAGEKRVSKADVLVLAKKHIMDLEQETKMLEDENRCLAGDVEGLKRRWVGLGGMVMP